MPKYINIFQRYAQQINNLQAPGLPGNKICIFVDNDVYNDENVYNIEDYINQKAIPWAFMNGVYLLGMTHGNFAVNRSYINSHDIMYSKEEDYSLNVDVLNYVFGCMAAANEHRLGKKEITMVLYIGEEDVCKIWDFKDEEEFTNFIKEDLEYLEEGNEDLEK